ncbi:MAG: COQ9 family protein [Rhodospirillales bacterium]|nr:COQ9 family protein [Rhodospirillales bacterium]
MSMAEIQDKILLAALGHVPFDGWTEKTLAAALDDAGFGREKAVSAFPGGTADLIAHFSAYADRQMVAAMQELDLESMRVRDRIAAGVRLRLEWLSPHHEAVRRATAWLALPMNVPLAIRLTAVTCDEIWHAAGDRSVDFNYYTKRGLLAPVYTATVLYWLADSSEGSTETWAFLDRRLSDVLKIPRLQSRLVKRLERTARYFKKSVGRRASGYAPGPFGTRPR